MSSPAEVRYAGDPDRRDRRIPGLQLPSRVDLHGRQRQPVAWLHVSAATLTTQSDNLARPDVISIVAAPVLVLLIPIFDTSLVTMSRLLSGRSAAQGGRDHSSHRLVAIGLSERNAVGVLWLLAAMGGTIGVWLDYLHQGWASLAAAGVRDPDGAVCGLPVQHSRLRGRRHPRSKRARSRRCWSTWSTSAASPKSSSTCSSRRPATTAPTGCASKTPKTS